MKEGRTGRDSEERPHLISTPTTGRKMQDEVTETTQPPSSDAALKPVNLG